MNNLLSFYRKMRQFAENHNMINEFMLLGSVDEMSGREFDYRTLILIPTMSNVSRDLSNPIYTLTFQLTILDKCEKDDEEGFVISTEENLFVVGQIQDYLIQYNEDCYIADVDVNSFLNSDANITAVQSELTISFARKNYKVGIDI